MSTASTQNLEELFSLSNYEKCRTWGLREWILAFSSRLSLAHSLAECRSSKNKDDVAPSMQTMLQKLLCDVVLADFPLPDRKTNGFIHDVNIEDCLSCVYESNESINISNSSNEKNASSIDQYAANPLAAWSQQQGREILQNQFLIKVDIDAADDKIIKNFKTWLQATRQKFKPISNNKFIGISEFDKWHKNRILPYIDIVLLKNYQNKPLSLDEIRYLIFKDVNFGKLGFLYFLENTLIPEAHSLCSQRAIDVLNAQYIEMDGLA